LPQLQIVFHVYEQDRAGAQEWLDRANKILLAHQDQLISPTRKVDQVNVGTFCPGHVIEPDSPAMGPSSGVPTPRA